MREQQDACDNDEQYSNDFVKRFRLEPRRPFRSRPRAYETSDQQVDDDWPMYTDLRERDRASPKRQRRCDYDKACRLVQDDGLQPLKAEIADKQRKAKLGTARADKTA